MNFTIEVEKKTADEQFAISTLAIRHKECCGGKISVIIFYDNSSGHRLLKMPSSDAGTHGYYRPVADLSCDRCKSQIDLECETQAIDIIRTSVDGEKRKIGNGKNRIISDNVVVTRM